jgi:hypothetical protein
VRHFAVLDDLLVPDDLLVLTNLLVPDDLLVLDGLYTYSFKNAIVLGM